LCLQDPSWKPTSRTTCVAPCGPDTHERGATRAATSTAYFSRFKPRQVRAKLEKLVADPAVKITLTGDARPTASPRPSRVKSWRPSRKLNRDFGLACRYCRYSAGATDGEFTNASGIPTFGVNRVHGPTSVNIHGLNEYVGVRSLLEAATFLYRLVKIYAEQNSLAAPATGNSRSPRRFSSIAGK